MSKNPSQMYQIKVDAPKWEKRFTKRDDMGDDVPLTRAEWKARPHRHVHIEQVEVALDGYTPEQVLSARRWAAGIVARVTVALADEFSEAQRYPQLQDDPHRCPTDDLYDNCGFLYEIGVTSPWSDGDFWKHEASVCFVVPTTQTDKWLATMRRVLAQVLDDDTKTPSPDDVMHVMPADLPTATLEPASTHKPTAAPTSMKTATMPTTGATP
ncbi:hypothetical protein [Nocardioides bigeumensis]|uniref:Uncharacterized protein n=1 Tax=Nocardioides bigeumensis TaxID=433657 RepID=A0ABP5J830_9ACTN